MQLGDPIFGLNVPPVSGDAPTAGQGQDTPAPGAEAFLSFMATVNSPDTHTAPKIGDAPPGRWRDEAPVGRGLTNAADRAGGFAAPAATTRLNLLIAGAESPIEEIAVPAGLERAGVSAPSAEGGRVALPDIALPTKRITLAPENAPAKSETAPPLKPPEIMSPDPGQPLILEVESAARGAASEADPDERSMAGELRLTDRGRGGIDRNVASDEPAHRQPSSVEPGRPNPPDPQVLARVQTDAPVKRTANGPSPHSIDVETGSDMRIRVRISEAVPRAPTDANAELRAAPITGMTTDLKPAQRYPAPPLPLTVVQEAPSRTAPALSEGTSGRSDIPANMGLATDRPPETDVIVRAPEPDQAPTRSTEVRTTGSLALPTSDAEAFDPAPQHHRDRPDAGRPTQDQEARPVTFETKSAAPLLLEAGQEEPSRHKHQAGAVVGSDGIDARPAPANPAPLQAGPLIATQPPETLVNSRWTKEADDRGLAVPDDPVVLTSDSKSLGEARRAAEAPPLRQDIGRTVTAQVAEAVRTAGDGRIEIRLSPEELGRVRMSMTPTESGLHVAIMAERPETIDLIRRNVELLAQDLRAQGHQSLNFSFGSDGRTRGEGGRKQASPAMEGFSAPRADLPSVVASPVSRPASGALDLRL